MLGLSSVRIPVTLLAVLAMGVLSTTTRAAEVALPEGVITPGASVVIWSDVSLFTEEAFQAASDAVVAAAPEADRERLQAESVEDMAKMKPLFAACRQLEADGVLAGALTFELPDPAAGGDPIGQLLVHTKPGSNPEAALKKAVRSFAEWARDQEEMGGEVPSPEELDEDLAKMAVTKINENWHCITIEGEDGLVGPADGNAAAPAPFVEALQGEKGAVVSAAWIMTPAVKEQLNQAMADPNAMMMIGVLQPLTNLKTASGGLHVGADPKIKIAFNFSDEASATAFKTSVDGMVQFFGQMAAMGAQDPNNPDAPDPAQIQAVIGMMALDANGATVSKTLDTDLLEKMTEAGIPWSSMDQGGPGAAEDPGDAPAF